MGYRPSALESFIAGLPNDLQVTAMQAVCDELNRLKRKEYTIEEQGLLNRARQMGQAFSLHLKQEILRVLEEEAI